MTEHELFRAGCWHELVYEDGTVSKWWSIKVHKSTHIREWGALGSDGRSKVTEFANAELARTDASKKFNSQISQGYKAKKPHLNVETELVHSVDYVDLENFINSVYGLEDFSFVVDQECSNDSSHRFRPDGTLDDYDREQIKELLDGKYPAYMTDRLLNDCVRQRLIPAGVYIVEV